MTVNEKRHPETRNTNSPFQSSTRKGDDNMAATDQHNTLSVGNMPEKRIFHVLIGVTGSVATIKLIELTKKIKSLFPRPYTSKSNGTTVEASIQIKIVMTKNSQHFTPKNDLINSLDDSSIEIYDDLDEWSFWKKIGDPVLHIELRKWADLCLIAPLDANTMAKLATGICDNLLTCVVRAWDISKPLVYCPAMNVHMYNHPITREQLCRLQSFGYLRVDCVEKRLACGDFGLGGMASVESISNKVVDVLIQPVMRKLSLTRPILNQQPTYPIISMTDDQRPGQNGSNTRFSPSISSQILNRFRTSNQITIHPVPNTDRVPNQTLEGCATEAKSLLNRQRSKQNSLSGNLEECYIANNDRKGKHYITITTNAKHTTGGVTSVQNLKAIGLDHNLDNTSLCPNTEEEMETDFDPSKLLEQSMTTDDSIMILNHDRNSNAAYMRNLAGQSFTRSSSLGDGGSIAGAKVGSLTSLFNTSKFLASCYNKERECFACTICKHDYKNRKSMARHLKEQHVQGNIYHCEDCGVSYKRREKLIKHLRERHPDI